MVRARAQAVIRAVRRDVRTVRARAARTDARMVRARAQAVIRAVRTDARSARARVRAAA